VRAQILAALGALCVLSAQSPAPAPTPLTEIGRTHSKGFCTTVRDSVAPSVLGLMKTDELVGASHRAMAKMAHDQAHGTPEERDIDRVYARRVVAAMAHNLGVIKKMLSDEKRFPKNPASDDDRFALLLKAQLQAAADRQNETLNHVNGILETTAMGEMRNEISTQMASSVANAGTPNGGAALGTGDQFLDASSVPGSGPGGMFQNRGPGSSSTAGGTIWDKLVRDIEVQQARIAGAEQRLTPTVIAASAACRGDAASPAP
jgi:hypothetical protein